MLARRPITVARLLRMNRLASALPLIALLTAPLVASASAPPKVTLLDAGKGNKVKLRFAPKKGAKQTATFRMQVTLGMTMGARRLPSNPAPATIVSMSTEVVDLAKNGDIAYAFELTGFSAEGGASANPQMKASIDKAAMELVGTKGRGKISNTGYNLGMSLELPPSASPEARQTMAGMQQTMDQLSSPVPEEAVGVGAKWRVDSLTDNMGVKINQSMTYTVKSMKGSIVTLDVAVTQSAASAEAELPGLGPGTSATIESMTSQGTGTLILDMSRVLPNQSDMKVDMVMKTNLDVRGQKQQMDMTMSLDVRLASK